MNATSPERTFVFRRMLVRAIWSLGACAALVTTSYSFVDKPVAFFVHDHDLAHFAVLRWLTEIPMALQVFSLLMLVYAAVKQAWKSLSRLDRTLLAASISLIVAVAFEYYLKFLFGRYWPDTWIDKNPSLIDTGAYGFNPFHFGEVYGSFPSGHTLRTFAFLGVIWAMYPAWRWVCVAVWISVVVGLVGMNYHFVGDTIGGAFVGVLTAMYTTRFFGLMGDESRYQSAPV